MSDNDVLEMVKESMSGVHMQTPVEAIVASGRIRRRRRLSGLAVAGVAVGLGLTLGVPAVSHSGTAPQSTSANPAQLAAFTLVSNPNGTATLTLTKGQALDPETLRQALEHAGVPALVKVGTFCHSQGQPTGLDRVLSSQRRADGTVVIVITPSAMPKGAELSIGYKPKSVPGTKDRARFTLVTAGAPLTCSSFQ
jgi:hypothetical protein